MKDLQTSPCHALQLPIIKPRFLALLQKIAVILFYKYHIRSINTLDAHTRLTGLSRYRYVKSAG